MTKIIKIIALLSFSLFSVTGHAKQEPMSGSMDMKQCMKMEQCKGMMDHSNMSGDTANKKQKTKTNNVFE